MVLIDYETGFVSEYFDYGFGIELKGSPVKPCNFIEKTVHFTDDTASLICSEEDYDEAGVTLTEYLDDRVGVAFDEGGRAFRTLKVSFIPFCVVCDKHRRVVWCGNGNMLTHNVMDKILTSHK